MDPSVYLGLSVLLASLGAVLVIRRRRRNRRRRKYWVRPWLRRRECPTKQTMLEFHKELMIDGDVHEFRSTLRMDPTVYAELLDILTPALSKQHTNFRNPISPDTRLAITLRFFALGEGFRSLSQMFRVGLSTTRVIVRETCQAVARMMQDRYLKTPQTEDEWLLVAQNFQQHWDFPHCLGTIDGKHIRMMAPRKSGTFYYNYKDFFSIVLLAIVDSAYQFLYIDIGSEGKASDGGIWAKSSFHDHMCHRDNPLNIPKPQKIAGMTEKLPYFLIGDDAFRLGANLMKPFPGGGYTKKQEVFNYRLCRCRRIVENAFGILTCRFKVFKRTLEVNPDYVSDIVMATCILHNFLRQKATKDYIPAVAVDQELEDGSILPGAWRQEVGLEGMERSTQKNASEYAKKIRNNLADYFISPAGEVEWQYRQAIM